MHYKILALVDLSADTRSEDDILEAIAAQGFTDSLVGLGVPGKLSLECSRSCKSKSELMTSVTEALTRAVPSAKIVKLEVNLENS